VQEEAIRGHIVVFGMLFARVGALLSFRGCLVIVAWHIICLALFVLRLYEYLDPNFG
jgi:hypothetical protein